MNNKTALVVLFGFLIIGILLAAAAQYYAEYFMPNTSQISGVVSFELGGEDWTNGTLTDWGMLEPGQSYGYELNVTNTGSFPFNVTVVVKNCNCTWYTFEYASNGTTLDAGNQLIDDIILTVDAVALPPTPTSVYTFDIWILTEEP